MSQSPQKQQQQLHSDINFLIADHKNRQELMQEKMDNASSMLDEENLEDAQKHELSVMLNEYGKMKAQAQQQSKILDSIKTFMDMNDEQKIKVYSDLEKAFGEINKPH
jgi:hypothetical protein